MKTFPRLKDPEGIQGLLRTLKEFHESKGVYLKDVYYRSLTVEEIVYEVERETDLSWRDIFYDVDGKSFKNIIK